ncbi:hypothetical protein QBC43DRAFT_327074 [Cladorrhinum sp. PSN259]|nr:hypothetical protein QBC43DRAFT_327074 [Cladorrhinum sp. PSN259]
MYRPVRSCDLEAPATLSRRSVELRRKTTELFRTTSSRLSASLSASSLGEARSNQKYHSADFALQPSSRNSNVTLPEEEDSDSDVEPLDDGHNVIHDRGESLHASQQAALNLLDDQQPETEQRLEPGNPNELPEIQDEDDARDLEQSNLRARLLAAKVANGQGQLFIPANALSILVTATTVKNELLSSHLKIIENLDDFSRRVAESAKKTFAVLAIIDRVADISVFMVAGIRDRDLPLRIDALRSLRSNSKETPGIRDHSGLETAQDLSHWSLATFDLFFNTQWQLLTPYFTGVHSKVYHYKLDENDILPFVADSSKKQTEVIEGGFGTVKRVRIHEAHHGWRADTGSSQAHFAVKRVPASNKKAFEREVSSLRMINRVNVDGHLITLKATIEHQDSYYMVFDWADGGNLRDFWKSTPRALESDTRWMLEQLTQLAKALEAIHSDRIRPQEGSTALYGRHGDIKPENILLFRDSHDSQSGGKMVIADFGLTRFHRENNSQPRRLQGTPTYRPPECDITDARISSRMDIWALGCVMLEHLVWLLGGTRMLDEFAAARTESLAPRERYKKRIRNSREDAEAERGFLDDSFFDARNISRAGSLKGAVVQLNPSVTKWIRRLGERSGGSNLLHDLLELIENRMLVTDPERRIDSWGVRYELEAMAAKFRHDPSYGQIFSANRALPLIKVSRDIDGFSAQQAESDKGRLLPEEKCKAQELDLAADNHTKPDTKVNRDTYAASLRIVYSQPDISLSRQILDISRRWMEKQLDTAIDWWPLPALAPVLAETEVLLVWEYGGKEMFIAVDRERAERFLEHEQQSIKRSSPEAYRKTKRSTKVARRAWNCIKSFAPAPNAPGGILPSWSGSSSPSTPTSSRTASINSWISYASTWLQKLGSSRAQLSTSPGQTAQGLTKGALWKETYLCVDKCWTSARETRLGILDSLDSMTDDAEFFLEARKVLSQTRGTWFQRFLSWRSYTRVDLSLFHFLFDDDSLVKTFTCAALPQASAPICQGYVYTCGQSTDIKMHMDLMAERILHGIRSPKLGKGKRTVLNGIPKREAPPQLKQEATVSGWGFHAGQGPCLRKIVGWVLVILVLALGFVPIWLASINKIDLQNAFAPGTFLCTVFAIIVACFAVLEGVS